MIKYMRICDVCGEEIPKHGTFFNVEMHWFQVCLNHKIEKFEMCKNCFQDYKVFVKEKKHIPKKPIKTLDGNLACQCGLVVQTGNHRKCLYYCDNCGQKIDWSDTE